MRIQPLMLPGAYKTYSILAPLATHHRPATCAEANCPHYLNGWRTIVPADSPQAEYIRHDKTRSHAEARQPDGLACFTFGPGQRCYSASEHRVRVEREERFIMRGGDFRGNPTGERRELSPGSWVDDFGEHQERIRTAIERG